MPFKILTLLIIVTFGVLSCSDKGTDNEDGNSDVGLSWLTGNWTGTLKIEKVGACTFSGDSIKIYNNIKLEWCVGKDGNITINDKTGFPFEWDGFVNSGLNVTLLKTFAWEKGVNSACSDSLVSGSGTYSGKIIEESSAYRIEFDCIENWCPADGCSFRLSYSLAHAK